MAQKKQGKAFMSLAWAPIWLSFSIQMARSKMARVRAAVLDHPTPEGTREKAKATNLQSSRRKLNEKQIHVHEQILDRVPIRIPIMSNPLENARQRDTPIKISVIPRTNRNKQTKHPTSAVQWGHCIIPS
jgi:hypothetical protein